MRYESVWGNKHIEQLINVHFLSPRWESNSRPTHYECVALPLSYLGGCFECQFTAKDVVDDTCKETWKVLKKEHFHLTLKLNRPNACYGRWLRCLWQLQLIREELLTVIFRGIRIRKFVVCYRGQTIQSCCWLVLGVTSICMSTTITGVQRWAKVL